MIGKAAAASLETIVLDAGGRYGMHPSWQGFKGDLRYFLFEPDRKEAARLAAKYADRANIEVVASALGDKPGKLRINVLRHHGQSTAFEPNPKATWFDHTRRGEGEIVDRYEAPVTTVDAYCDERGLALDFMKLDTEGSELSILKGATQQLHSNVLALLCELHFDEVYIGAPLFPDVFKLLRGAGFQLLNLDYNGGGAYASPFFDGARYGILSGCDSVWVRPPEAILGSGTAEQVIKYAMFCMRNGATDLALHVLQSASSESKVDLRQFANVGLVKALDVAVQHLFYRLSHRPRYDFDFLDGTYHRIFGRRLKPMHEFFESDEINPS